MNIKKIIITADVLRVENDCERKSFIKNTNFIYRLLNKQLNFSTNLPIEIVESGVNQVFDYEKAYDYLKLDINLENWAKVFDLDIENIPTELISYFSEIYKNSVVIGFELPPVMVKVFDAIQIPCISISWHPIRFMDDIFFGFLTNNSDIFNEIAKYQLPESAVYISAETYRARALRSNKKIDCAETLLIGQTKIDRSVIYKNKVVSLNDFKAVISDLTKKNRISFKPHPFANEKDYTELIVKYNFSLIGKDTNVYKILASEDVKKVVAISSGTLHEARFFEKESVSLIKTSQEFVYGGNNFSNKIYLPVKNNFMNADFWADILKPILQNVLYDNYIISNKPNRLRTTACISWGYEEIDLKQIIEKY
jgi:hypothetical protein